MKSFLVILTSLFVLTACTVPGPGDFESTTKPMAEDEFITMWRFPAKGISKETIDGSEANLAKLEAAMEPFFQQIIPRIFTDVKNGKLEMREEEDVTDLNEKVIDDLPARMSRRLQADWQNLTPYMGAIHLTQRRKSDTRGFPSNELELSIIEQDPDGKLPETVLGSVSMEDLVELDYTVTVNGETSDLLAYLGKQIEFGYPIYFKGHELEAGLRTLEQAFSMKDILFRGEWSSVEWLAGEPNLSGFKMKALPASDLNKFTGTYVFQPGQGSGMTKSDQVIKVHIDVENDYLNVEWTNLGPYSGFDIFPSSEKQFFTLYGDQIEFIPTEDGKMRMTLTEQDGTQNIGYR